jgi:hypothetical protein
MLHFNGNPGAGFVEVEAKIDVFNASFVIDPFDLGASHGDILGNKPPKCDPEQFSGLQTPDAPVTFRDTS